MDSMLFLFVTGTIAVALIIAAARSYYESKRATNRYLGE